MPAAMKEIALMDQARNRKRPRQAASPSLAVPLIGIPQSAISETCDTLATKTSGGRLTYPARLTLSRFDVWASFQPANKTKV